MPTTASSPERPSGTLSAPAAPSWGPAPSGPSRWGCAFDWEGRDPQGRVIAGRIHAHSSQAARLALARQGILAQRLRRRFLLSSRPPRDPAAVALFVRQLASLIRAGLPLTQALQTAGQACGQAGLAATAEALRQRVATGRRLSESMREHPGLFAPVAWQLVAVGEEAGLLETTLDRLAGHLEQDLRMRRQLRAAMIYPATVLAVAAAVVAAILVWVVPTFESVFASMGAELPTATRALLTLSALVVDHGAWVLAGLLGTCLWLRQWVAQRPSLQSARDRISLRLPVIGEALLEAAMARWTRMLSMMVGAGVPLLDALAAVAQASANRHVQALTQAVRREVATGRSLAAAMGSCGLFPPLVVQMAAVGEESGSLDSMLGRTADLLEAEMEARLRGLAGLIEPVLIVVLGVVISALVLALYRPIFALGSIV